MLGSTSRSVAPNFLFPRFAPQINVSPLDSKTLLQKKRSEEGISLAATKSKKMLPPAHFEKPARSRKSITPLTPPIFSAYSESILTELVSFNNFGIFTVFKLCVGEPVGGNMEATERGVFEPPEIRPERAG